MAQQAQQGQDAGATGEGAAATQGGSAADTGVRAEAVLEAWEAHRSGEVSDLISVLKLARWYEEGLIRFPRLYSG